MELKKKKRKNEKCKTEDSSDEVREVRVVPSRRWVTGSQQWENTSIGGRTFREGEQKTPLTLTTIE